MKYLGIGLVVIAKISIVFKILNSLFQLKFFGIAAMGLVMQLLKFWLDVKSGYNPPKFIPYDGGIKPSHFIGEDIHWSRHDKFKPNIKNSVFQNEL